MIFEDLYRGEYAPMGWVNGSKLKKEVLDKMVIWNNPTPKPVQLKSPKMKKADGIAPHQRNHAANFSITLLRFRRADDHCRPSP